jgi:hypothetical protein
MKRMEHVDFELAFKQAASATQKVGWVSVFNKAFITIQKVFSFKAKAFSFCLFYYTQHRHSGAEGDRIHGPYRCGKALLQGDRMGIKSF